MSLPTQSTAEHIPPQGAIVSYSTNVDTPSYTAITDVKKVQAPPMKYDEADDTQLASTGQVKESSPGWGTNGPLKITAFVVQTQDAALRTIATGRSQALWRLVYGPLSTQTTGLLLVVKGWIEEYTPSELSTGSSDKLAVDISVHVTGVVTYTPGS